jgi:hypothetical protein
LLDLDIFLVVKPLIFQALLRLSRASGLHPRCLPLSELQKVGELLAGGGFGDIYKGLVDGQTVCVKIMRIFEDANINAALKVFSYKSLKFFVNMSPGIRSRSCHLAPAVSPKCAPLLRYILSGQQTMFGFAMDGRRARYEISRSQATHLRETALTRKYMLLFGIGG